MSGGVGLHHTLGTSPEPLLPGRLLRRLWARLRWRPLDEALAGGSDPSASFTLACRAAQLTSARRRRRLGRRLENIRAASHQSAPVHSLQVMPDRREVELADSTLEDLEALLLSPTPVYAKGVAGLELLTTDGCSCLYSPTYPGELNDELEHLALTLEGREEGW